MKRFFMAMFQAIFTPPTIEVETKEPVYCGEGDDTIVMYNTVKKRVVILNSVLPVASALVMVPVREQDA